MATIDRRSFVAGAAALGVGAALTRAHASANDAMHVAIVGAGGRCRAYLQPLFDRPDATITAVCDPDAGRAAAVAARVQSATGNKPPISSDFRRVLDDESIDVVFIATPHHWHGPIAVRAVAAGKDVYVEKPASHVFREGRLLVDAARRHKRIVQHGTQMRSSEVTAKAGEVLKSGLLGEVKMTKAWNVQRHTHRRAVADTEPPAGVDYDVWLGPAPKRPFNPNRFHGNWQWYRDYGNGDIGNDGIHDIDMARWGLGVTTHPTRITAHGSRIDLEGEREYPDNMTVSYQYGDDKVLIYEDRGWTPYGLHGYDSGNAFYGTEGYMIFTPPRLLRRVSGQARRAGPHVPRRHRYARPRQRLPRLRPQPPAAGRRRRGRTPLLRPGPPGRNRLPRRPRAAF